jgi:phosphopantetheinyl transferase (holo-ACP synthase)
MYVGNDIVAYKHSRCVGKWQQEKFLQKILQLNEVEALKMQINKDAFLWTLWTLKEAAYKLSCFLGNRNKFHPNEFEIHGTEIIKDEDVQSFALPLTNVATAKNHCYKTSIHFKGKIFYGHTLITHQYIHSLVTEAEQFKNMYWAIGEHQNYNKNDYSNEVRAFAKQQLYNQHYFFEDIIKDVDGIPFVLKNEEENFISLSHDQQFVSFAIGV